MPTPRTKSITTTLKIAGLLASLSLASLVATPKANAAGFTTGPSLTGPVNVSGNDYYIEYTSSFNNYITDLNNGAGSFVPSPAVQFPLFDKNTYAGTLPGAAFTKAEVTAQDFSITTFGTVSNSSGSAITTGTFAFVVNTYTAIANKNQVLNPYLSDVNAPAALTDIIAKSRLSTYDSASFTPGQFPTINFATTPLANGASIPYATSGSPYSVSMNTGSCPIGDPLFQDCGLGDVVRSITNPATLNSQFVGTSTFDYFPKTIMATTFTGSGGNVSLTQTTTATGTMKVRYYYTVPFEFSPATGLLSLAGLVGGRQLWKSYRKNKQGKAKLSK